MPWVVKIATAGEHDVVMQLNKLHRHEIVTGSTGTAKTITIKVMTEQLSKAGVPLFLVDIKGDLASLSKSGTLSHFNQSFPVTLWNIFGKLAHPVRTIISEMDPLLLSRLLELNETQTGILNIAFRVADDNGLLLIDIKDLKALLTELADNSQKYIPTYGNITKQSVGAVQKSLISS